MPSVHPSSAPSPMPYTPTSSPTTYRTEMMHHWIIVLVLFATWLVFKIFAKCSKPLSPVAVEALRQAHERLRISGATAEAHDEETALLPENPPRQIPNQDEDDAKRRLLQKIVNPIIPTSDQDEFGAITARRLLQKKDRPINPRLNQNQTFGVRRLLRNNQRPRMRIRQN